MLSLTMLLLERVGLIIILAYVLMNIPYFKNLMNRRRTWKARWQLCIIFSLFALMSNLTGIVIDHQHSLSGSVYFRLDDDVSLANTRIDNRCRRISWWPFVGLFVGVISGIFRVYMGGADAQVYLISSIFIGIIAGYFGLQAQRRKRYPSIAKSAMIELLWK